MSDGGSCVWEAGRVDTRSRNHPVPAFQPRGRGLPGRRSYGPIFPDAHIFNGEELVLVTGRGGEFLTEAPRESWVGPRAG